MNGRPPVSFREPHSALNRPLLAYGLIAPAAAEITCLILGVVTGQPWFFVIMAALLVPAMIWTTLLYRNWPTGIRFDWKLTEDRGGAHRAVSLRRMRNSDHAPSIRLTTISTRWPEENNRQYAGSAFSRISQMIPPAGAKRSADYRAERKAATASTSDLRDRPGVRTGVSRRAARV